MKTLRYLQDDRFELGMDIFLIFHDCQDRFHGVEETHGGDGLLVAFLRRFENLENGTNPK
jgi:hypothetical protein